MKVQCAASSLQNMITSMHRDTVRTCPSSSDSGRSFAAGSAACTRFAKRTRQSTCISWHQSRSRSVSSCSFHESAAKGPDGRRFQRSAGRDATRHSSGPCCIRSAIIGLMRTEQIKVCMSNLFQWGKGSYLSRQKQTATVNLIFTDVSQNLAKSIFRAEVKQMASSFPPIFHKAMIPDLRSADDDCHVDAEQKALEEQELSSLQSKLDLFRCQLKSDQKWSQMWQRATGSWRTDWTGPDT